MKQISDPVAMGALKAGTAAPTPLIEGHVSPEVKSENTSLAVALDKRVLPSFYEYMPSFLRVGDF